MQYRSQELFQRIEALAAHYSSNLMSPYLKASLANLPLSRRDSDEIELLTARIDVFRHQGYHLDELYLKLLAMARFIKTAQFQWTSGLRSQVVARYAGRPGSERVMAEMVVNNFPANLSVLADQVMELFALVKSEDQAQNEGKARVLRGIPEAKEIPALLGREVPPPSS